jgi:hypothetical protein
MGGGGGGVWVASKLSELDKFVTAMLTLKNYFCERVLLEVPFYHSYNL